MATHSSFLDPGPAGAAVGQLVGVSHVAVSHVGAICPISLLLLLLCGWREGGAGRGDWGIRGFLQVGLQVSLQVRLQVILQVSL